ncbi:hypothetical protein EHQ23_00010 [Leptospira bourretii]|uniref:Uncharacterized protein n=1 Tax=Leptospira bourretii TaxID=2484962 RepID=A0A4R9ISE3_9LEPT|nr:hypothetical protein EHQ23_00010 [Leptospira bourretii]TGK94966.1 hypothetical protein EHQ26_00100 [Leptospira bourretii]TGL29875.1 hypothetical protein EHQ45_14505 [Leptospira bourretii]
MPFGYISPTLLDFGFSKRNKPSVKVKFKRIGKFFRTSLRNFFMNSELSHNGFVVEPCSAVLTERSPNVLMSINCQ